MRPLLPLALIVVLSIPALSQSQPPAYGTEVFLTLDFAAQLGESDWDNLVLEDESGAQYVFEYNSQAPIPGLFLEPYGGAVFQEGPYRYESLFVDFSTNLLSGSPHHHPQLGGGNPGGWTYFHNPMALRIFRADNQKFRLVSIDYRDCNVNFRAGTSHIPIIWDVHQPMLNDSSWNTFEFPLLSQAADGNVGGALGASEDILTVDGGAGGNARRVTTSFGQPITLAMEQPAAYYGPATFFLFGTMGIASPDDALFLPAGIGDFCFTPVCFPTSTSFLFASSYDLTGVCVQYMGATATPWSVTHNGPTIIGQLTLQAIVLDDQGSYAASNAIVLRIEP